MFHGHFAFALLFKSLLGPSIPSLPIFLGSSILDIIGGLDGLLGLDILQPDSTARPYMYTRFVFVDWEHSLLMMLVWTVVFGWVGCHVLMGFKREAGLVGAASVVVHWGMDCLVIEDRLTLWPHGRLHFGLGLYDRFPVGSWAMECALCAVFGVAAVRISRMRTGADVSRALVLLGGLALLMSPWTSPLLLVAKLYERGLLEGVPLSLVQFVGFSAAYIVPALMFTTIVDRAEMNTIGGRKAR